MNTRIEVFFSGRVQGVGFRATVFRLAHDFKVVGRVCNLSDGRVELLAEGERAELAKFKAAVIEALDRNISEAVETWTEAKSEWNDFSIGRDKYASRRQ